jgi:hypothetical protein
LTAPFKPSAPRPHGYTEKTPQGQFAALKTDIGSKAGGQAGNSVLKPTRPNKRAVGRRYRDERHPWQLNAIATNKDANVGLW